MSNIIQRGVNNDLEYLAADGLGTEESPYIPKGSSEATPSTAGNNPIVIASFGQEKAATTLLSPVSIGDKTINVVSAAGMVVGQSFFIVDTNTGLIDQFRILSIVSTAIGVDVPSGNAYAAGVFVGASNTDMSVDGSSTPVKFNIKTGLEEGDLRLRLTRIMITMLTDSSGAITDFGDIAALTNGLYLRQKNTVTRTIFNVKTNFEIAGLAYDLEPFSTAGFNNEGYRCRLTFTRMGGVIDLPQGEDLEFWVQDDLTDLTDLQILGEGTLILP